MLERKLYVQHSTGLSLLEVKEIILSWHDTKVRYFYTGCRNHKWYRMSHPRAEQLKDIDHVFKLLKESNLGEYPEAVAWLEKYHLPKAEVIYV